MYDTYAVMKHTGEALWMAFLTALRPQNVKSWGRPLLAKMTDLLIKRGVHVVRCRHMNMAQALIDVLHRKEHIPSHLASEAKEISRNKEEVDHSNQVQTDIPAEETKQGPVPMQDRRGN